MAESAQNSSKIVVMLGDTSACRLFTPRHGRFIFVLLLFISTIDKIVWVRCLDENEHRPKEDPKICVYGTLNT